MVGRGTTRLWCFFVGGRFARGGGLPSCLSILVKAEGSIAQKLGWRRQCDWEN